MQRIETLLQKLTDLSKLKDKATPIEIDLMMDYTRVIYADLIEWRNRTRFTESIPTETLASQATAAVKETQTLHHAASVKNIQSNIGINDKYQYVNELFNNDVAVYTDVINTINSLDTEVQAINWLQSNFHWDDENETAQSFYRHVKDYFISR